jgi:hypothetical protein
MPPQPLSPETRRRLDLLFAVDERPAAEALLVYEVGNGLPMLEEFDMFQLERVRFAALKLSEGSLGKLREAVTLAQEDWRDLLMLAGFFDDIHEHESWTPEARD